MNLPIPAAALAQHLVALGKTRSGKSSKLRVCVEYLLQQDKPVSIIDPKGDWWGLKSSADGKHEGFPIVIFGGEHADVAINAHSGAHVAELFATGNRSCLIDLGGWMVGDRTRFFIEYASTLFKLTRGARHQVIDEVHNFAPQGRMDPEAGKMLHWANRLASEGQGKGLTLLAASQRPQKVHKDFLTSCETLIACRVIHKLDRDAIKDWIDGCADPAKGREVLADLAQMGRADAWTWSPEIDFGPKRITFPMFATYDSFKPQQVDAGKLKGWAEVDLEDVKAKLAAVVEESKANDPKILRALNAKLGQRVAELERNASKSRELAIDVGALAEAEARGRAEGLTAGITHAGVAYASMRREIEDLIAAGVAKFTAELRPQIYESFKIAVSCAEAAAEVGQKKTAAADSNARRIRGPVLSTRAAPAAAKASRPVGSSGPHSTLPPGERATLGACIQYPHGLERSQLTVITGYKRSSRDAYIQRLREKGFVNTSGDRVTATQSGVDALPDFEPLPRGQDLVDFWNRKLPDGERKVLAFLLEANGDPVARERIDEATGYQRSSRDAYLQRLRAKQLVVDEGRGQVKASPELFA